MPRILPLALVVVVLAGCNRPQRAAEAPEAPETGTRGTKRAEQPPELSERRKRAAEAPKTPTVPVKVEKLPAVPEKPSLVVFAFQISDDYRENELRARNTYLNTRVRLVGVVQRVTISGSQVHVRVKGDDLGLRLVTCKFPKDAPRLDQLGENVVVIIDGTGDGKLLSTPLFRDCVIKGGGYFDLSQGKSAADRLE
jgi:hypothetical protein